MEISFCSFIDCPRGQFTCSSRDECLDEDLKCDGNEDCADGSDEAEVCGI